MSLRGFRRWLADFLRMLADAIEPVRTIEWGSSVGDAPITVGETIRIPDEWLDWPGKAEGAPRPRAVFYRGERELPRYTVECRARFPREGCGRRLAPGQYWEFCGERNVGMEGAVMAGLGGGEFAKKASRGLCRECGGLWELATNEELGND